MKNVSTQLRNLIALEGVNLCRIWTITLVNGDALHFTDLNSHVLFGGDVYVSNPGITVSAIQTELNGGPSDATIEVSLRDDFLSKEMARRGSLDRAEVDVRAIDYLNPQVGFIPLFNGIVRSVIVDDTGYCSLDCGGWLHIADRRLVERFSETCRWDFGGPGCGVDVEALGIPFTVHEVGARGGWFGSTDLAEANPARLKLGTVRFTSGHSTGQTYEVGEFRLYEGVNVEGQPYEPPTGRAFFLLKTRFRVEAGDEGIIFPGCAKFVKADCSEKFDNVKNFRGEPFVPNLSFSTSTDIVRRTTTQQTGYTTEQVLVNDQFVQVPMHFRIVG